MLWEVAFKVGSTQFTLSAPVICIDPIVRAAPELELLTCGPVLITSLHILTVVPHLTLPEAHLHWTGQETSPSDGETESSGRDKRQPN